MYRQVGDDIYTSAMILTHVYRQVGDDSNVCTDRWAVILIRVYRQVGDDINTCVQTGGR